MKMEFEFEAPNEAVGKILQEILNRRRWTADVRMEEIALVPVGRTSEKSGAQGTVE